MDPVETAERFGARNYHPLPVVLARGEGAWVWDTEGRRYLDCLSAYSAVSHGHCHPEVLAALETQARRLTLTSRAYHNDRLGPFLARLCEISDFPRALPMNTGAEAVETAIKAARKWGYTVKSVPPEEAEIVVCAGNFHGRTTTIVGFSTEPQYRAGFGPFTPGFVLVPYGDAAALEAALGPSTVAFLVEPIQGEAGIRLPPDGYLRDARALCDRNGTLLVLDEIQTGLGRTGALFAFEHEGIRPDAITVGKALGGGVLPVSALVGSEELLGVFAPGDHGSTFGGNPLAAAVGLAALDVLARDDLAGRSRELGAWLLGELQSLRGPRVREVRGRGLFVGIELTEPARPVCEALLARGVLTKDTHGNVIRIAPPLVVERDALAFAVTQLREVLAP